MPVAAVLRRTMRGRRQMVERHQQRVHGGAVANLDGAVDKAFRSYARYWVESFRLPDLDPRQVELDMSWEGLGHLHDGLAAGRGAIVALPHLGGWEHAGAWLSTWGLPATVVVEPIQPAEVFDWFVDLRRRLGMNIVPLGPTAGGEVLGALRRNQLVCLLCDRDLQGNGTEVEFFGERTTLPSGPATLALRTGAALLPTAVYFQGRAGHLGVVRAPVPTERSAGLREDVARVTQRLADELELLIRAAPDQWHLFQPNWPSDRALGRRRI